MKIQITQEQQKNFPDIFTKELEKVTMSWDNELRMWHPVAIESLLFASPISLQIPQETFIHLFDIQITGINMNVVMRLCNNLEMRTAMEMNYTARDWAQFLITNGKVGTRWNLLQLPIRDKIFKQFEEENNNAKLRAKIMGKSPGGMKLVKGEA
jgi:hypothetical protein